jgi:hypothetical protein
MSDEVAAVATPDSAPGQERGKWGGRSITSLILFIIATLLLPIALIGHWGHRTVIDSERYIATVGPLIDQPQVQAALSEAVTNAVVAKADTQNQVQSLLGGLLKNPALVGAIAAPIASGINTLIGDLVTKFIASDQFNTVWIELNKAAQKGVVAVLEGGQSGPVQVKGDEVVLDVSSALAVIQQHLVDSGITAAGNVTIPDKDRQVVLFTSPALAQIRFIYALTSPILQWLPLLVAALFALSIALARRRARTVVATGIVLTVTAFLLSIGLAIGETAFTNQLTGTPFGQASQVFWDTLLEYLVLGIQGLLTLGIVLIVAGWFGGRTTWATMLRGHVTKGLGELSARMPSLGGFGAFVRERAEYVRWAIYAVLLLILLFSNLFDRPTVLWVTALGAGLVTLVQLVAGTPDEDSSSVTTVIPSETDATIR